MQKIINPIHYRALADCIKKHPGISEIEAQTMIERGAELSKEGLSDQAAARKVLEEYRSEIDRDFDSLRKQLKVKGPSVKERPHSFVKYLPLVF